MMGKQYNRMKQLAKQNILRAEKTEVLNDDLQQCEKRVDIIRDSCQKTVKKLTACLQGNGQDVEKRTRKLPQTVLGQSMMDSSQALGDSSIFGLTLGKTAELWTSIGQQLTSHERGLEDLVIGPFSGLLENEIPSVMALRRKLNKLTLDLDSAKGRYQTASSKGVDREHVAKLEAIKEEMEQCQAKVDACKDTMATEMMNLVAKDSMLARCLVDMVECQAQYHRSVLSRLEKLIPELKENLTEAPSQGVFGLALEDHLRIQGREIAAPLELCIDWIMELGMEEEGIFRIAGSASKVKMIRAALESNVELDLELGAEHAAAGVLKQYLRELPEPLLTFALYPEFIQTMSIKDKDQKLQALWKVIKKLPKPNYTNFMYLIKFLSKVAKRSELNKMNASNLSLVVGPNLLWSEEDGGLSMSSTGVSATIIEYFINYADWFFPQEIDFSGTNSKNNSFSETTQSSVDGTDGPPTISSTPEPPDTNSQPSPGVTTTTSVQPSPVQPSPSGTTSPQVESSYSLAATPHLLTEKLKTSSLPRRSVKKNPAPPVPNITPTPSPCSSLPRNTPVPTASSPDVNNVNGNTPTDSLEKVAPERPERPSKQEKPAVKLDKPVRAEKPPVLEKPVRPPVPAKKTSQGRDFRPMSSPPPVSVTDNVPPSPTLRPKSTSISRPTISPPPPPPASKSPIHAGSVDSEDGPEEATQF